MDMEGGHLSGKRRRIARRLSGDRGLFWFHQPYLAVEQPGVAVEHLPDSEHRPRELIRLARKWYFLVDAPQFPVSKQSLPFKICLLDICRIKRDI